MVGRDPAASPQNLIHQSTSGREVAPGTVREARSVNVSIPKPRVFDSDTHTNTVSIHQPQRTKVNPLPISAVPRWTCQCDRHSNSKKNLVSIYVDNLQYSNFFLIQATYLGVHPFCLHSSAFCILTSFRTCGPKSMEPKSCGEFWTQMGQKEPQR